jgi:hypothetical protein
MFSIFTDVNLSRNIAFSSLLLLAACGGGGSSDPSPPPSGSSGPELAASYTDLVVGSTFGKLTSWTSGSANGAPIEGVICAASETYHAHAVVTIYQDGVRLAVPGQIGLSACAYELHTHDATGIVHLEAASQKPFTLGQFFAVWGQPLSATSVAGLAGTPLFYTIENEKVTAFTGDPRTISLAAHKEIAIVVGTPPAKLDKNRLPAGY